MFTSSRSTSLTGVPHLLAFGPQLINNVLFYLFSNTKRHTQLDDLSPTLLKLAYIHFILLRKWNQFLLACLVLLHKNFLF
jgi:hypothetical protein